MFVAQGYHDTSMDDIAERAGVSKPVLYQHFPSKLELYLALLDQHTGALLEQVEAALALTTDNKARVTGSFAAYFDFVDGGGPGDESHGAYRLVFESDLRAEPAVRERVERNLADVSEAIARTIAEDTGASDAEAHLLSVGLAGMAEVAARWWMSTEPRLPKERAVELLSGARLAGAVRLAAPAGLSPSALRTARRLSRKHRRRRASLGAPRRPGSRRTAPQNDAPRQEHRWRSRSASSRSPASSCSRAPRPPTRSRRPSRPRWRTPRGC